MVSREVQEICKTYFGEEACRKAFARAPNPVAAFGMLEAENPLSPVEEAVRHREIMEALARITDFDERIPWE